MMKNKILKATILGLSLSVLVSGTALAQGGGSSPSFGGISSEETDILLQRQDEINSLLFDDHARDIELKGFEIIYTGVADGYVEVGINPYSKDNAKFLYEIVGKDAVKVVASDEVVLYAADPLGAPVANSAGDSEDAPDRVIMDTGLDTPVSSTDDIGLAADGILADEDKLEIQIDSFDDNEIAELSPEEAEELSKQAGMADDEIMENTSVDVELDNVETTDTAVDTVKEEKGLSTPIIIAIVAGGVLILGGALLVFNKK
ncbi:MAG TPA: hypothetical protein GXZ21_00825 [Clostridiales bacterium]|nr:hypothetical protein [Clostridiales bacterium]